MHEFFHGWRRKAGCFTLVIALVFTAAWKRSYDKWDQLVVGYGPKQILVSTEGEIRSISWSSPHNRWRWGVGFQSRDLESNELPAVLDAARDHLIKEKTPISESSIPYWPIATLTTLVSAYLILWKSRRLPMPDVGGVTNA